MHLAIRFAELVDSFRLSRIHHHVPRTQLSYTFEYKPGVIRMPNTAAFYQSTFANYNRLFKDASSAIGYGFPNASATARLPCLALPLCSHRRFNADDFDTYVVLHGRMTGAVTFSGLGFVGLPGVLANGEFDIRVVCHGVYCADAQLGTFA